MHLRCPYCGVVRETPDGYAEHIGHCAAQARQRDREKEKPSEPRPWPEWLLGFARVAAGLQGDERMTITEAEYEALMAVAKGDHKLPEVAAAREKLIAMLYHPLPGWLMLRLSLDRAYACCPCCGQARPGYEGAFIPTFKVTPFCTDFEPII